MRVLRFEPSACRRIPALMCGVTLSALLSSGAWAQLAGPAGTGKLGRDAANSAVKVEPAPDAIPGAKARGPAIPSTKIPGDMQPTDALFDAINRGDIAAARDALNRGADLSGVNILGMTPMELSVDLGRNDISFLLLSMRAEEGNHGSSAVGSNANGHGATSPFVGGKTASGKSKATGPVKAVAAKGVPANTIIPNRPVATPKLFANDGGTPQPNAGFLGFDSRSAAN